MKSSRNSLKRWLNPDLIFAAFLLLYPMRHICWGLDLWDTGYNYANFTYMGLEHMDSMWLFSTYLSTAAGHFLTLLPGAGGLVGMNFYTGLFVSALALLGYFFCTRKLGMDKWVVFVGELLAVSLCWCPTALLYNYITYVFFLLCVILLYIGLTDNRRWLLFAAGVCLGCNVLVRFSNLPEAAMIVAVWAWDFIVWRQRKKAEASKDAPQSKMWAEALRHTLWCLGGYLAALAALLGYIHLRYGIGNYAAGIRRLFAMTENAEDYTAKSMLMGMFRIYLENMYWVLRFGIIVAAGIFGFALLGWLCRKLCPDGGNPDASAVKWTRVLWRAAQIGWGCVAALMLVWLYRNGVYSFQYFSYDPILRPATLFLMLTLLIAAVRIFHPACSKEEKLISGMVVLVVLLTPIGSNNGLYPAFNNLFVAGPYALWECWHFVKNEGERTLKGGKGIVLCAFPAKAILVSFLAMFLFQSAAFGACFMFVEATGARNITDVIENNSVLQGVKMSPERARWMSGINAYVDQEGLRGREVILFGQIPSLSYYLQMPSAFNPWSDLRSYSCQTMELDMRELSGRIDEKGQECPVIILEKNYAQQYEWFLEGGAELLRKQGVDEKRIEWIEETGGKYRLIQAFSERYNYDLTFENEKFRLLLPLE